jgi:hypothetical protein
MNCCCVRMLGMQGGASQAPSLWYLCWILQVSTCLLLLLLRRGGESTTDRVVHMSRDGAAAAPPLPLLLLLLALLLRVCIVRSARRQLSAPQLATPRSLPTAASRCLQGGCAIPRGTQPVSKAAAARVDQRLVSAAISLPLPLPLHRSAAPRMPAAMPTCTAGCGRPCTR